MAQGLALPPRLGLPVETDEGGAFHREEIVFPK